MAMVSLLIAPLIDGNDDWEYWYIGLIILVLCIIASLVLMYLKILTWQDPLGAVGDSSKGDSSNEAPTTSVVPTTPPGVKEAWAGAKDPAVTVS